MHCRALEIGKAVLVAVNRQQAMHLQCEQLENNTRGSTPVTGHLSFQDYV